MARLQYVTIFALLSALSFYLTQSSAVAAQAKSESSRGSGQASTHMSAKGQANTNAQWFADPERGWVRAEERHELHEARQSKAKKAGAEHKNKASKGGKK